MAENKLKVDLSGLGLTAKLPTLTYEQASFYRTLYYLLVNCLGKGTEPQDINNAKKIIDLIVSHKLELELQSAYHNLKSKTPEEVNNELQKNQNIDNLIIYCWFEYCKHKKQSIHLLDFEQSNLETQPVEAEELGKYKVAIVFDEYDLDRLDKVTRNFKDNKVTLSVSAWSANNRILGATSNRANSLYDYSVVPYLKEIADNLSINSDTQEVALMKGVQLGATTGILENFIGYSIEHISNASMLMVTATDDLAKERMDKFIKPMILDSKMEHRIISSDFFSKNKKSGATSKQMEWVGGGYLKAIGSNSGSSLRSLPIKYLLLDEVDSYPEKVGKDGDPVALAVARTTTFGANKKILYISTPLIEETSQIYKAYLVGDQRKYVVPCLECGEYQDLVFNKVNKETGEIYGLTFKTLENGNLDYDSVEYLCRACQHPHKNYHKTEMLARGKWMPTAEPQKQGAVSYQISGLYSPASFKSWEDICYDWLQCWDIYTNKPKDIDKLQVFYNNNLGVPFREVREKLQLNVISQHKRNYARYVLPQAYAEKHTGQKIRLITAAVDVHEKNLAVIITGWAAGRCFLLDYVRIKGNCTQADDEAWSKLWELLSKKYTCINKADPVTAAIIFIDSGYLQGTVEYAVNRSPLEIKQKTRLIKGQADGKIHQINFKDGTKTLAGKRQLIIYTDNYKELIYNKLQYAWQQGEIMPDGHFNAYNTISKQQLKELTNESKQEVVDKITGKIIGYKWERKGDNELFDGLVYNYCAIEFIAQKYYTDYAKMYTDLPEFDLVYFWQTLFPIIEQQTFNND